VGEKGAIGTFTTRTRQKKDGVTTLEKKSDIKNRHNPPPPYFAELTPQVRREKKRPKGAPDIKNGASGSTQEEM